MGIWGGETTGSQPLERFECLSCGTEHVQRVPRLVSMESKGYRGESSLFGIFNLLK